MSHKEHIYKLLPEILQKFVINIEGKKIRERRYSAEFNKILKQVQGRDKQNSGEFQTYLINRLKKNLISAFENTVYYKSLFGQLNFDPYTFHSLDQLKVFPIQDKAVIKSNYYQIRNKNIRKKDFIMAHTSGTTGSGLIFPFSKSAEHELWATWWRYRINLGIKFDTWCALFGGRTIINVNRTNPPFWKTVEPTKQVMFSMYHLNNSNIREYVNELNRKHLPWIHGYPSSISFFAGLMLENGVRLNYQVSYITTGAENLLDNQKEIIRKAFGVVPHQHYGLSEAVANISECEFGKMHIDDDFSYVELIPIENANNKFRLIGTSIINDAFFFLRYDTKDIVSLSEDQKCKCGRNGRIVDSIDGREEDFITLEDGTKIGRLDHIFKDLVNISEAQVFQNEEGIINFYIVKASNYDNREESKLKDEISKRIPKAKYTISYVNKLQRTDSGKLRFVVSKYKFKTDS